MYSSLFTVAIPVNYTSEVQELFEATVCVCVCVRARARACVRGGDPKGQYFEYAYF
jgi:hypothetical protein